MIEHMFDIDFILHDVLVKVARPEQRMSRARVV